MTPVMLLSVKCSYPLSSGFSTRLRYESAASGGETTARRVHGTVGVLIKKGWHRIRETEFLHGCRMGKCQYYMPEKIFFLLIVAECEKVFEIFLAGSGIKKEDGAFYILVHFSAPFCANQ